MEEADRFRRIVEETSSDQGFVAPGRIAVLDNPKRRASATALRFFGMGTGFIITTHSMLEDLSDDELRAVVRHELVHYRYAEARWAPIQALAGLSPLLVVVYGWPIAHTVGKVPTLVLYALALIAHVLAFKSKRYFESRADRESVRTVAEARAAQRALLKFATLKQRAEAGLVDDHAQKVIAEMALEMDKPPTISDRVFNEIWGVHPLLRERLASYDEFASRNERS